MLMQYKLTLKYLFIFMFLNIYSSQVLIFMHIDMIMYLILMIKIIINFYF